MHALHVFPLAHLYSSFLPDIRDTAMHAAQSNTTLLKQGTAQLGSVKFQFLSKHTASAKLPISPSLCLDASHTASTEGAHVLLSEQPLLIVHT